MRNRNCTGSVWVFFCSLFIGIVSLSLQGLLLAQDSEKEDKKDEDRRENFSDFEEIRTEESTRGEREELKGLVEESVGEFVEENKSNIELSAKRKKYYHDKEYWDLVGDANIRNKGDFLIADKLQFFVSEEKVRADGRVRFFNQEDEVELRGQSGEYFSGEGYAKLTDRVQLWIRDDEILVLGNLLERNKKIYTVQDQVRILLDSEGNRADAQEIVYEQKNKKIILKGNPKVFYEDASYQAHEIWVFTKTKEIVFQGRVRVFQDDREIRSQRLHYFSQAIEKDGRREEKKAIFTGHPEYFEYSDPLSPLKGGIYRNIQAEKMIFFEETETWQIQNEARFKEFYLEKVEKVEQVEGKEEERIVFEMYQREAGADEILYREDEYVLQGRAWYYDREQSATAEKITVHKDRFHLSGNPKLYEFKESIRQEGELPELKRRVQSDFIEYWKDEKQFFFKDDVVVEEEDYTFRADFFRYEEEKEGRKAKGYAHGKIEMEGEDQFAQANKMMFWGSPKEKLVLEGSAYYEKKKKSTGESTGRRGQKKETIQLVANRMEHWDNQSKSRLYGSARVWDGKKRIRAEEIQYQEIGGEERIQAQGKLTLKKGNEWVRGEKMLYWKDSDREVAVIEKGLYTRDERRDGKRDERKASAERMIYKNFLSSKRELFFLEGEVRIWDSEKEVRGQSGEYWILSDQEKAFLTGPCKLTYFDKDQKSESDFMEYQKDQKGNEIFILRGNAKSFQKDESAKANSITFYPKYEGREVDRILLAGSVRVEDSENQIEGERMEIYDGEIHTYEVWESGKYIHEKEQLEVTGDRLFYDEDRDWMEANGKARYWDEKEELEIFSEKIQSDRKKKRSIALGNVEIHQEPRIIYGDFARFEEEKNQLYVTGSTKILEGENLSESRSILLDTEKRMIEVVGVRRGKFIPDN